MSNISSFIKKWLDRILVLDLFLVILGSLFFILSITLDAKGIKEPLEIFQVLWKPIFIPAITILICASLLNGVFDWWKNKVLDSEQDI